MRIGVPRETKVRERRVALTPAGAHELVRRGHDVLVEAGAGEGSSLPDADFVAAGAKVVPVDDAWGAELVLKVKEPLPEEHSRLRRGQVLFTYLHLAASRECTRALLAAGTTAIAYEIVQLADGSLPLLAPMSEVAGRLAPQVGAYHLMAGVDEAGGVSGRGVLMGGVPGVPGADVVVLGGGVSGRNAAQVALGMGAQVTVLDLSLPVLRAVDARFGGAVRTVTSTTYDLAAAVRGADLVVGAVLVPGARAPKLVSNDLVAQMRPGSVLVDIAIDQGGCFADSRPTTHDDPTYAVHGSVFYCVANMPGAVPHTSTHALTGATLPYVVALADRGWRGALAADPALVKGLATHDGQLASEQVADAHGLQAFSPETLVAA